MYRICEVDGHDDEIADTLTELHRLTFFDGAPIPEFDRGHWWLAFQEPSRSPLPVCPSTRAFNTGYFCRVGVLRKYCGNALQLRLMRALEWRARQMDGVRSCRIPPKIWLPPTTLSVRATRCTSRHIHGRTPTRCTGENPSNSSRGQALLTGIRQPPVA